MTLICFIFIFSADLNFPPQNEIKVDWLFRVDRREIFTCMRRLQMVTHSAWTANILTMLHRIWDLMIKCFHAVRLRKLIWIYSFLPLAILQVKTSQTFTSEQWQLGSDYARACGINMVKKICESCAQTQVYLWLRMCRFIFVSAAIINAGDKKNEYMTNLSTRRYLECLHCYLRWNFFKE